MNFKKSSSKYGVRMGAALLLAALSATLLPYPVSGVGIGIGLAFFLVQGFLLIKTRPGNYDLNQLRDLHERALSRDEPDDDNGNSRETGNLLYCHRCSISVPSTYAICPQCGGFLGK